ncbi:kelch-like protein 5 [Paramacrobiotus metropolitanus]|uniref:kelch-like protein 5 n=1 Tax=Paramacrobiotus metropolitanus TaxID=2943436 RepID=UPI002446369C|nr:kelch-like protein 5 [Paramacrobiotus metropolitanus]
MADLRVTESNVQSMLIAAAFLDIATVVDACWKFMDDHIDVSNCLMLYCFADSDAHKNPTLANKAKTLVLKHFVSISKGQEFLQVAKNTVLDLIRSDDLWATREEDVLLAVMRWLHHDLEQRRGEFWEILQNIRLSYLGPQGLDDYLVACINAVTDYSGGNKAMRQAEYLKTLPGSDSHVITSRRTPRKAFRFEAVIICAGGNSWKSMSDRDRVDCFNPHTSNWRTLARIPFSVALVGLATFHGDLFLCGNGSGESGVTPRTLRYNPAVAEWKDVAPMRTGRGCAGVAAVGRHIYAVGGHDKNLATLATVERYDVLMDQWTFVASLPWALTKSAVVSFEGKVFTFGGSTAAAHGITDSAFSYDPKSDRWSELPKMPSARSRASVCVGPDGWIYVIGGFRERALSCVEAYNPSTKQWINKHALSRPSYSSSACCFGEKIYVLGGYSRTLGSQKFVEIYDILSDTWTTSESPLPVGRWGLSCSVADIPKDHSEYLEITE